MKRICVCIICFIILFSICSCKSNKNEVESAKSFEIANSDQTIAESLITNKEISATGIICTKDATYHRNHGVYNGGGFGLLTVRFPDDSYAWVLVVDAKQFASIQIGDTILVNALYSANYPRVTY